jgi:hypothetical protein
MLSGLILRFPRYALASALFASTVCSAATRDAARMNAIPQFQADIRQLDWSSIPEVPGKRAIVFQAIKDVAGYNMHPALSAYRGKLFAMWSSGAWGEDMPGQKVRFASSPDGVSWSEAAVLAEPDPECMLTPTGFWVRYGELYAMAIHRRGKPVINGKRQPVKGPLDHTLRIYRYEADANKWVRAGQIADTFNDKPIERLASGEWAMIRLTLAADRYFAVGGKTAIDDWRIVRIPMPTDGSKMSESHLHELDDGTLSLLFRDNARSNFLYRAYSEDRGMTWTTPVRTNFPDQTAKFSVLKLSRGGYVLVSNPRPGEERVPLTFSLSNDGWTFDRVYIALRETPPPALPNFTKRLGAQYPHAIESNGAVFVIYSINQEAIEVVRVPVDSLLGARR